jgi:hypothetical protein
MNLRNNSSMKGRPKGKRLGTACSQTAWCLFAFEPTNTSGQGKKKMQSTIRLVINKPQHQQHLHQNHLEKYFLVIHDHCKHF